MLVYFGARFSQGKIALVRDIQFAGHADEAGYLAMARSLAEGRGLNVPYVSWHFIRYPPDIVHREDHWPPFLAFAIAPFFWGLGVAPWVGKIAPILIGSLGLPLAAALLGLTYSRRAYVALAAGLLMLLNPFLFTESLKPLADVAEAMLVTAFCAALLAARNRPWWHLPAGLLAAAAYYAKGSELVLIALYPLLAFLTCGGRSVRTKWPWFGMLTALLLILPWLVSNTRLYGNPLHSTQNYVSGYIGLHPGGWEGGTYYPYLGRDLPKTSDRWTKYRDSYPFLLRQNGEAYTRWTLFGPEAEFNAWDDVGRWGRTVRDAIFADRATVLRKLSRIDPGLKPVQEWSHPASMLPGVASLGWVALLGFGMPLAVVGVWRLWRRRRYETAAASAAAAQPWLDLFPGCTLALVLVGAVHWVFLVVLWEPYARLSVVMLPLVTVLGCTALAWLAERPALFALWVWERLRPGRLQAAAARHGGKAVALAAALLLLLVGGRGECDRQFHRLTGDNPAARGYPYRDQPGTVRIGAFLKDELPDAVFMSRNPWEILFHASPRNRGVTVPLAGAPQILAVARYYGVTHYIWEIDRPALRPYLTGRKPGFRRLPNSPGFPVYEILWDQIPPDAIDARPAPDAPKPPPGGGVADG